MPDVWCHAPSLCNNQDAASVLHTYQKEKSSLLPAPAMVLLQYVRGNRAGVRLSGATLSPN